MKTITKQQAADIIRNIKGNHAFTVEFVKKDGTLRKMNAVLKCVKHLKGGESTIKHKSNLIGCYDMQSKGYRAINTDTLKWVKAEGQEYKVEG